MSYTPRYQYELLPSRPDSRDYLAKVEHYPPPPPAGEVPAANIPAPRDQSTEGACWGFCGTNARMVYLMAGGQSIVLSPAFLYYNTRQAMGDTADDTGSDMRTGLDTALKIGLAPESLMPYQAGAWRTAPSADAVAAASQYAIAAYARVNDMDTLKAAIAAGHPCLLGITVYEGFERAGADGIVPPSQPGETPLGGHAILCVGYKDDPSVAGGGRLKLLNSWGPGAGDHGFYYIPYSYLNLAAGATGTQLSEAWVISPPVPPVPPPHPPTPKPARRRWHWY
jgi:C1A family cysteine protease